MRDDKNLWIRFKPKVSPQEMKALGWKPDLREIIIDVDRDVRICDGETVVKVLFHGKKISGILKDDVFLVRATPKTLTE